MSLIVGLTGGINSGKSTIAHFFNELGVPIIDADVIARKLVAKGSPALTQIAEHFGNTILTPDKNLNRHSLRERVFENAQERKWLENLLHPEIYNQISQLIKTVTYPYCIVVVPLLTENYETYKSLLHYILVVDVTEERQIEWGVKRDNCDKELIKKMILAQASKEARLAIADRIISNHDSIETLKDEVKKLHAYFLTV